MPQVLCTLNDYRLASDADLLALVLSTQITKSEAVEWMTHFRSFTPEKAGLSKFFASIELARRVAFRELDACQIVGSSVNVKEFLHLHYATRTNEVFSVMFLDARHQLLAHEDMFFGTIDTASVYPREIIRIALQRNASAVVLAHNHPSGLAEPSLADITLTQRIKEALGLFDIRLLDHIVVGQGQAVSMAERGHF
jgi:DNA repair protein RadC